MSNKIKPEEEIELVEHRAMITLPEIAIEVKIEAIVYIEGELHTVTKTLNMSDIRDAFQKADDGYIDDEDKFYITEKGKEYLKMIDEAGR